MQRVVAFTCSALTRSTAFLAALILALGLLIAMLSAEPAAAATSEGAVISNGTVMLGVNKEGDLNYDCAANADPVCPPPSAETGTPDVGLRYQPLNLASTEPGCLCEGWGVADAGSGLTGYANQAAGDANITVESFSAPSSSRAISTVSISDPAIAGHSMRVVHDYQASPLSPNLFAVNVSITNTGTNPITDLRYRRVMDWDVEPTAFSEWVTIQGTTEQLLFDSDDGFATSDPLAGPSYISSELVCGAGYTGPCQFTDLGADGTYPTTTNPEDHGALFDFGFGALAPGSTRTFTVYYGAADSETSALAALEAGGAQVYSLGESDCAGATIDTCAGEPPKAGPEEGRPATFIFAFVTAAADLSITKTDDRDPVRVGQNLTYTLRVSNAGPETATGVQVTDDLPDDVEFVSANPSKGSCTGNDDQVTCNLGALANGANATVEIRVRPLGRAAGTRLTNQATVSGVTGDTNLGNNSATQRTRVAAFTCQGKEATIIGTKKADTINGTPGRDVIQAFAGADVISGGGGNDLLCGAKGADRIRGGAGGDFLQGSAGADTLRGDAGKDRLVGAKGQDRLVGGPGGDTLGLGGGDDVAIGGPGNDRGQGQTGDDDMSGGAGNDRLTAGKQNDRLRGDAGADDLRGRNGNDRIDGGPGADQVRGGPGTDRCGSAADIVGGCES